MAYFLFVDESGHDLNDSPYEVLGGIAIEDRDLWNLIQAAQETEIRNFGQRYSNGPDELKGKRLLKSKVFRHAAQLDSLPIDERRYYAQKCLEAGAQAGKKEITALAQAKLAYVSQLFDICLRFRCKAFASIINTTAHRQIKGSFLRKDYVYLFERFFYYVEDTNPSASGIVVFDEEEKSQSHILLEQMSRYFKFSAKGKTRADQIIPEPFFVHSDLTTGIQIADLISYVLSWGFRTRRMMLPKREELFPYVDQLCRLRHLAIREVEDNPRYQIWSFKVIDELKAHDIELD